MKFKTGFGPGATILWDTDWGPERKSKDVQEIPNGARVILLLNMFKKRDDQQVLDDLNLLLDSTLRQLGTWGRRDLHSLRATLPLMQAQQHIPAVENAVRAAVRPADTGGVPPQKKHLPGRPR